MPKRQDLQSILVIGAGPIVIGQACEFDYSGMQACKALKDEGFRVILVNSNPATIMTDPETADAVYIEPITWQTVERIIEAEKPDALLPTMGGQTALNCALDLYNKGVLEKHGIEMIGATQEAIDMAEDRSAFRVAMTTSSATRRWPRSTRSRAISDFPIPAGPVSRSPIPYTSTSEPWTVTCWANWSSRKSRGRSMNGTVRSGVRKSGTPRASARPERPNQS